MLIAELLRHVARNSAVAEPLVDGLDRASAREFQWALDAGLGPLLLHAAGTAVDRVPAERRAALVAADLTARVLHGSRVEATKVIIEACSAQGTDLTLLKGISTCEQFYASGHHRRMTDIDVLVPANEHAAVEAALLERGFERGSDGCSDSGAHGVPLIHREFEVWLEIHRALFPPQSGLQHGDTFSLTNLRRHQVDSRFHGLPVRRFSPSFQLVYIAAYWMRDLVTHPPHPSHLTALFDAACLLRSSVEPGWSKQYPEWLDNDLARAALQVLMSYLSTRAGLSAPQVPAPKSRHWHTGRLGLGAIHSMLDACLLGARPWRLPVPPPVPGRYNVQRQIARRGAPQSAAGPLEW